MGSQWLHFIARVAGVKGVRCGRRPLKLRGVVLHVEIKSIMRGSYRLAGGVERRKIFF
jgi:hypothetical protein